MRQDSFALAVELEDKGDLESAAMCYQTLMVDDARAAVNLGSIHFRAKQYGLAADAFRQAVKVAPDMAIAWYNLGSTLKELFRTNDAIAALEMAVKLAPKYADAHFNLALLLDTSKQPRRAVKHWRAYVKLDPLDAAAARARRAIKITIGTDKLKIVYRRGPA